MASTRIVPATASKLWWLPLTVAGVLRDRESRIRWLFVPGLVGLTAAISTAGKIVVRRPRPSIAPRSRTTRPGLSSSFPSTHTACAFAIASWVSRSRSRSWPYLLAAGVGFARLQKRAHYLGDVLAGSALGYGIGASADWWSKLARCVVGGIVAGRRRALHRLAHKELVDQSHQFQMPRGRTAVAAIAGVSLIAAGGASRVWATTPPLSPETLHAKVRDVCPPPEPGDATCFALALVPAAASEAASQPYLAGGGALSHGPAGGLTPGDLATAYGFISAIGGTGQTVAIIDAYDDPHIEKDLKTFDRQYGLAPCTESDGCFKKISQRGDTTTLPAADKVGWSAETTLDVETAHSVCQSCTILLVEADSESLSDLATAANEAATLGATEISNSYGAVEKQMGETEQAAYDHPGIVVTAAAGDFGYLNWDYVAAFLKAPAMPNAPASLPSVVAVGGTSLKLKSNGARKSESVWNDSGRPSHKEFKRFSATGGGCSTHFTAPAWQQSALGWGRSGCDTKRLGNDIAAVADPYTGFDIYDTYQYEPEFTPGWMTIGGTSLSAPLVAALYGLAGGGHGVSYPAATLYAHLGEASSLYDVTAGGDGFCDGEEPEPCGEPAINEELGHVDCIGTSACDATIGFDGPSGVGTPMGLAAFGGPRQAAPTVETDPASSITTQSALLNASVNPEGEAVSTCAFEYGPTKTYGKSAPCTPLPEAGTAPVTVSATVSGLATKSTYHFRIVASNPYGTGAGKDKTAKTR